MLSMNGHKWATETLVLCFDFWRTCSCGVMPLFRMIKHNVVYKISQKVYGIGLWYSKYCCGWEVDDPINVLVKFYVWVADENISESNFFSGECVFVQLCAFSESWNIILCTRNLQLYLEQGNNDNNIINIFSRGALCVPLADHVSVRLFYGYEPSGESTLKPILRGDYEGHVSFNMSIALHLCCAVSVVKGQQTHVALFRGKHVVLQI